MSYRIKVDSVSDIDTAEALVGCFILAKKEDIEVLNSDQNPDLAGYRVIDDEYGEIGISAGLIDHGAQALLRVESSLGEVLIPFVPEIVYGTDSDVRVFLTRIPKGLLETASDVISS